MPAGLIPRHGTSILPTARSLLRLHEGLRESVEASLERAERRARLVVVHAGLHVSDGQAVQVEDLAVEVVI